MSVKWHGATRLRAKGHRAEEGRAPPLTSLRVCGGACLTDGTGTQGQAGRTQPTDRGIIPQPRWEPKGRPAQRHRWLVHCLWL